MTISHTLLWAFRVGVGGWEDRRCSAGYRSCSCVQLSSRTKYYSGTFCSLCVRISLVGIQAWNRLDVRIHGILSGFHSIEVVDGRCHSNVIWVSPCFGYLCTQMSQIPSVLGIPSTVGIPKILKEKYHRLGRASEIIKKEEGMLIN